MYANRSSGFKAAHAVYGSGAPAAPAAKVAKAVAKVSNQELTKRIKKVIRSQEEVKLWTLPSNGIVTAYDGVTFTAYEATVSPNSGATMVEGTDNGQRVGLKINVHPKSRLTATFYANQQTTATTKTLPACLRILFLTCKTDPTTSPSNCAAGTNGLSQIWDLGQSGLGAPQNNLQDMNEDVNKNIWEVHSDTMLKIGGANPNNTDYNVSNNDFSHTVTKSWKIASMLPKTLRFSESNNFPQKSIWMVVIPVPHNGTTYAAGANTGVSVYVESKLYYTDA